MKTEDLRDLAARIMAPMMQQKRTTGAGLLEEKANKSKG